MGIDLSTCSCSGSGFCEVFGRNFTEKDFKWCQTGDISQKQVFYDLCQLAKPKPKPKKRFVKTSDIYRVAQSMIPHVWPFDGIVGVPRSGMLAASYLSVLLSKPLFSIDNDKLHMLKFMSDFGGTRMNNFYRDNGVSNLVFIDDTTYNGTTADKLRDCFGKDIKVFSIFCTSFGVRHIDRFGEMLDPPHLLEWNFFNSSYVHGAMFDIDGVFCKNVPINVCQDEEKYIDWISNVEPIYERVPRLFRISKLVTGRLEKYRDITEAWLKKHAFYYDELIMFPTEKEEERNRNHYEVVGKFKADIFNRYYRHEYFVESEIAEAEFIRKNMKPSPIDKTIICPNEGVIL